MSLFGILFFLPIIAMAMVSLILLVHLLGVPFGAMGIGILAMLCLPIAIPVLLAYGATALSGLVVRTLKL